MSNTDNLYILDTEDEPNTIKVLEFLVEKIMNINKICKRYVRIYQLTPELLGTQEIQDALKNRNVSKLPSLVIFQPRSEVMVGVDEIILFYETLLKNMQQVQELNYQKRLRAAQESKVEDEYGNEPPLLDDTQSLVNNFYKNEIMSDNQEKSVSSDIGSKMSERYRDQLSQRNKGQPGRSKGGGIVGNDEDEDNLDLNKAFHDRRRSGTSSVNNSNNDNVNTGKDDVMSSVRKVTKDNGADGELEMNFFQNLLEDSSKL